MSNFTILSLSSVFIKYLNIL